MTDQAAINDLVNRERRLLLLGLAAFPLLAGSAGAAANMLAGSGARGREVDDREEIRALIALYSRRVADGVSTADLYADDGAYVTRFPGWPVLEARGRGALDVYFDGLARNRERPLPTTRNIMLLVDGDHATGICSSELRMTENGHNKIGWGYYEDEYRREQRGWRFVKREITLSRWVSFRQS